MMFPWRGRVRGTQIATRMSSSAACSRMRSSSGAPPRVSFATTRIVFMRCLPASVRGRVLARPDGLGDLGAALEDPVHGAADAVLVRASDDGGDVVEVEDGRWRRDLPLEGERPPRVRRGARA